MKQADAAGAEGHLGSPCENVEVPLVSVAAGFSPAGVSQVCRGQPSVPGHRAVEHLDLLGLVTKAKPKWGQGIKARA